MSSTRRTRRAFPGVLALGTIAALSVASLPAGALTTQGADPVPLHGLASEPLARAVAEWASPAGAPGAGVRSTVGDPFGPLGAARVALPTARPRATLRQGPAAFAGAVTALEQAALASRRIAAGAFAGLTPAERATLVDHGGRILSQAQAAAHDLQSAVATSDRAAIEGARDRAADSLRALADPADAALVARIDIAALAQAARVVADTAAAVTPMLRAVTPVAVAGAHRSSATLSCARPGPIYCDGNNLVEVWGPEDNTHSSDSVAMVRVDLGGNDTYTDHTATAQGDATNCDVNAPGPGCLTAMVVRANVDLGGDDTYTTDMGQGVGFLGIGVLYDAAGHDVYGALAGQGFSILGAGVVIDTGAMDDQYGSLVFGQAAGIVGGVGVLSDDGGNDFYGSLVTAQAATILGAVVLADGAGNDTYRCLAICQGTALGGAAVLADGAGNDSYSGLELFGLRIPGVMTLGVGMIAGAAAVLDEAGDDTFENFDYGFGFALSANVVAALTGTNQTEEYVLFYDGAGTDTYWSNGALTFGHAQGQSYCRFLDHGAGNDSYTSYVNPNPRNNAQWTDSDGTSVYLLGYDLGQPNGMGEDR